MSTLEFWDSFFLRRPLLSISAVPGPASWMTATASGTTDDSGSGLVPLNVITDLKSSDHSEMLI